MCECAWWWWCHFECVQLCGEINHTNTYIFIYDWIYVWVVGQKMGHTITFNIRVFGCVFSNVCDHIVELYECACVIMIIIIIIIKCNSVAISICECICVCVYMWITVRWIEALLLHLMIYSLHVFGVCVCVREGVVLLYVFCQKKS